MGYDPERAFVTQLIETGDVHASFKHRVTPAILGDAVCRETFEWVLDQFRKHGATPSMELVMDQYPEFTPEPTTDTISTIADALKERRLYADLQKSLARIATEAKTSGSFDALHLLRTEVESLGTKYVHGESVNLAQSSDEILAEYMSRKRGRGPSGIPWPWPYLTKKTRGICDGAFYAFYGPPGCLCGDTGLLYKRGKRDSARAIKLKDFFAKFLETRAQGGEAFLPSVDADGIVFYNRVVDVFESGLKKVIELEFDDGTRLALTPDHPVATTVGFVAADNVTGRHHVLAKGDLVTNVGDQLRDRHILRSVRLVGKRDVGERMTYDIQMGSPSNNFEANGVFVHNTMKTWLLLYIGDFAHRMGARPIFFTQEMPVEDIRFRWAAMRAGVMYEAYQVGQLTETEELRLFDALDELNEDSPPFIVEELEGAGESAIAEIHAKTKQHGCNLVLVDGLAFTADDLEWTSWGLATRGLKKFARTTKIPVIGTHHANRDRRALDSKDVDAKDVALGDTLLRDVDGLFRVEHTMQQREANELVIQAKKIREGALPCMFTLHAKPAYDFSEKIVPRDTVTVSAEDKGDGDVG